MTVLWVKFLKLFVAVADPGTGVFFTLDQESETKIPDPQHCSLKPEDYRVRSYTTLPSISSRRQYLSYDHMTGLLTFRRFESGGLRGGGGGLTARRRFHLDRLVLLARRVLQG